MFSHMNITTPSIQTGPGNANNNNINNNNSPIPPPPTKDDDDNNTRTSVISPPLTLIASDSNVDSPIPPPEPQPTQSNGEFDLNNSLIYPQIQFKNKKWMRKCGVCEKESAQIVVYNDRFTPENPFFFCQMCEDLLHRDSEGNALYDGYQCFPYE